MKSVNLSIFCHTVKHHKYMSKHLLYINTLENASHDRWHTLGMCMPVVTGSRLSFLQLFALVAENTVNEEQPRWKVRLWFLFSLRWLLSRTRIHAAFTTGKWVETGPTLSGGKSGRLPHCFQKSLLELIQTEEQPRVFTLERDWQRFQNSPY